MSDEVENTEMGNVKGFRVWGFYIKGVLLDFTSQRYMDYGAKYLTRPRFYHFMKDIHILSFFSLFFYTFFFQLIFGRIIFFFDRIILLIYC